MTEHPTAQPDAAQHENYRLPPHSIEAEQSVLGGLLLDNPSFDKIADVLTKEDFYRDDHRRIFWAICNLIEHNRPADVITVAEALDSTNELSYVGGLAYLGSLAQNTPSAANIRRYAEIVREKSVMRQLASVATEIADAAYNPGGREATDLLDEAESKVFSIAEQSSRGQKGFIAMPPILKEIVERIDHLYQQDNPSEVTGVATGFIDLDRMTSGLQKGDLIIVAGRPSMGKAQPLDARIKTLTGWKLMQDLKPGDELASVDGGESRVTGIYPQGMKQIYKVTLSDGRSTECCEEHLWRVMYRDWDAPRVVSTGRLIEMLQCVRYRNRLWVDSVSGDFGHKQELPVHPWVLGALLGDGTLARSHSSLMFSTRSAELVERMNSLMGYEMELVHAAAYDWRIVWQGRIQANGARTTSRNWFRAAIEDLGLLDTRSHDKFIPQAYLEADKAARLALLQGLLDTDGWIEKWGSIRYSTASRQLAGDVASLARSLGGYCSISEKETLYVVDGVRKSGLTAYVLNMSFSNGLEVFTLEEKKKRLRTDWQRIRRLTFKAIEPSRMAQAQCISVSHPTRTYVTDNYVVTHNTAFSINIAEHVAVEQKLPVAVFSMEMGAAQLGMRMVGSIGKIDMHKLKTGRFEDEDWTRLTHAVSKLSEAPIFIEETGALTALDIRTKARRLARQCGGQLGLIVIDYLQLMAGRAGARDQNRATELGEISRGMKSLAKELQVPIIALSQLSRSVEQRTDKRPMMSDLRESGAIEQDADLIMFMYRDEYYNQDSQFKGLAECIVGKHRNGPTGKVPLVFQGQFSRFDNALIRPDGWSSDLES